MKKRKVLKLIDEQIDRHTKCILKYERLKLALKRDMKVMDTKQKKEHFKKIEYVFDQILKLQGG